MDEGSTPSISTRFLFAFQAGGGQSQRFEACSLTKPNLGMVWHLTWYDWYEGENIKPITGKSIRMAPQAVRLAA